MSGTVKKSRKKCIINACSNNPFKNPELHFYGFPGRSYEIDRKKKWIEAVRLANNSDEHWVPGPGDQVCSAHFIGGVKSTIMHNAAYLPTIFPEIHNRKPRTRRVRLRKFKFFYKAIVNKEAKESSTGCTGPTHVDCGIQTDLWTEFPDDGINILFCWNNDQDASTQTNICFPKLPKNEVTFDQHFLKTEDEDCEIEEEINPFHEIKTEECSNSQE